MKRYLPLLAILAAVGLAPFAIAAGEGDPIDGGTRNPSNNQSQSLQRETEIIADTSTYGTRQSNKSSNGGGAIYGCRSRAGNEPCIRSNNLSDGRAFEFKTNNGGEGGRIDVGGGGDGRRPFTTNATGTASGLNADRVDGLEGAQLVARFAAVGSNGSLQGGRGAASASRTGEGVYTVRFADSIASCAYTATVISEGGSQGFASIEPLNANELRVRTAQRAGDNPNVDRAFHLVVNC